MQQLAYRASDLTSIHARLLYRCFGGIVRPRNTLSSCCTDEPLRNRLQPLRAEAGNEVVGAVQFVCPASLLVKTLLLPLRFQSGPSGSEVQLVAGSTEHIYVLGHPLPHSVFLLLGAWESGVVEPET